MKKKPTKKPVKKQQQRTPAHILNDIHEQYPVTMAEALRVISHLEERLIEKECARSKEILEAIERLRQPPPPKPEITEEMKRLFDKQWKKPNVGPAQPIPYWHNLPPVVIQPWDPCYPFKPIC